MVDISNLDAGDVQARLHCLGWEPIVVLLARKPFLARSRNEFTVANQRRRRVVVVRRNAKDGGQNESHQPEEKLTSKTKLKNLNRIHDRFE